MGAKRLPVIREEVTANIRSAPYIAALQAILAAALGFAGLAFTLLDVGSISRDWHRQDEAGSSVLVVSPDGNRQLSAARCDGVNGITGVLGAGGIIERVPAVAAQSAAGVTSIVMVTPGFPAANWRSLDLQQQASVVTPVDFAEAFGLSPGQTFIYALEGARANASIDWQSVTVDWMPNGRGRVDGINDALMMVRAPVGVVQSCLISAVPASAVEVEGAARGWFGDGFRIEKLVTASDLVRSSEDLMGTRASIWAAPLGCTIVLLLQLLVWFGRRSEFALYRALGISGHDIRVMLVLEVVLLTLLPFQAGALSAMMLAIGASDLILQSMAIDYARLLMLVVIVPLVGAAVVMRTPPLTVIKGY